MQFLQGGEYFDHLGAGQHALVQLDEGLVEILGAENGEGQVLEYGAVLPRLTTVGQGHKAGGFELVGSGEELVEGGRRGGAGFGEHFRVDPQPVDPVHVDRHGYVVAAELHHVDHLGRQQLVPLLLLCHLVEVGEQAQLAPLLNVRALDLRGGRRVTGNRAGLQHGHGRFATAAGNGEVLPGMAFVFNQFLQGIGGAFFATGGPPMQHFDFTGMNGQRHQGDEGNSGCQA